MDGLRAISVLMVILGHSVWPGRTGKFFASIRQGSLGVAIFFVISGFLITHLLLKELNRTETISLKRFYVHRAFRILPPFYVFLAVVGVRSLLHIEPVSLSNFACAGLYVWNYNLHFSDWILGHLWSLSLEEQFYLLWPLCLVFFSKRSCLRIACVLIALEIGRAHV